MKPRSNEVIFDVMRVYSQMHMTVESMQMHLPLSLPLGVIRYYVTWIMMPLQYVSI